MTMEPHRSRPLTSQAAHRFAGLQIDNLDGSVGWSSREKPLLPRVHRHVVEASLNIGQRNSVEQGKWRTLLAESSRQNANGDCQRDH
jgi:hypothetical protein